MPVYNLVITIIQFLSDNYTDSTECIYQKRHHLDKALSKTNEKDILKSVNNINDDFFTCFEKTEIKKIKMIIYSICKSQS